NLSVLRRIPLLAEEGWPKAGVVSSVKSRTRRSDHPVCAASVASRHFFIGAASPPLRALRGGESEQLCKFCCLDIESARPKRDTKGDFMRSGLLSVCCLFLFCGTVWAQATAQIAGTVRDESGAIIPGVEIKVTQTATGAVRTTLSNEEGRYVFAN